MRTATLRLAIAGIVSVLTISACGTTEDAREPSSASGEAITVTDSRGKEIRLDAPAQKVVAVEWAPTEQLVSLGVMPTGVADVKGFKIWDRSVQLDDSVTDVGTRGEPSSDTIAALEPDLIIAPARLPENVLKSLETRAPVLVVNDADTADAIGTMRADTQMIAKAVGKQEAADKVLADMDAALDAAAKDIAAAELDTKKFAMADAYLNGANVEIRMFGEGSLMSDVAKRIGLEPVWEGKVDESFGLGQTDIEGLTKLPDVQFFYSASDSDPFKENLAKNPIWEDLEFVQQDHVHKLPDGTWTFGGPASVEYFADAVVDALTK